MPRSPNDKQRQGAVQSPKRARQTKTPHRTKPPAASKNVAPFSAANAAQAKTNTAPYIPEIQQAIDMTLSFTPLQLLAVIIKALLRDRIKDEEVHRICQVYYDSLASIWGDEEK